MRVAASVLLLILGACGSKVPSSASDEELLFSNIDASFSSIPFGTPVDDVSGKLTNTGDETDHGEQFWLDDSGIVHRFSPSTASDFPVLDLKGADAESFSENEMHILGIGTARVKSEVLANIKEFAPTLQLECSDRTSGETYCFGDVGKGSLEVDFDPSDQLDLISLTLGETR